jgi:DNA polymerase
MVDSISAFEIAVLMIYNPCCNSNYQFANALELCIKSQTVRFALQNMPRKTSNGSAEEFFPDKLSLPSLREAAADCKACDLWKRGTQTVFGEGRRRASVLFVGEQPGNEEDLTGKPFVGPAGRLFDNALAEAGIERSQTYVTNVVKHFKWEPRGKRRIHKKPNAQEIAACRPWLEAEIALVKPKVIVALGATAA